MGGLRMDLAQAEAIHARNGGTVTGKPARKTKRSNLEQDIEAQLTRARAPAWESEYRYHCIRDWRFDLAWPDLLFAVEVDGLVRGGKGGHQTIEGVTGDCQKVGEAMLWGWQVYRCTGQMVKSGEAVQMIMRLLTRRISDRI